MPQSSPIFWAIIIFMLISTFFVTANSINAGSAPEAGNSNAHSFMNNGWTW